MTINNEKHLEQQKPEKSGDHQVAGTPITNTEDNAHQQRQEKLTALKAYRFTKGDAAPFTIDMGNGEKVQDKRPLKNSEQQNQSEGSRDLVPARMDEKTGKVEELGKDGKWHKAGSIPASQEAHVGEYEQDKKGNWHKTEHAHTSHQTEGSRDLTPSRMDEKTGKTEELGKDGKWHKAGTIPPGQEATVGEYQQDKDGNWHKAHEKSQAHGERGFDFNLDNAAVRPHPKDKHFDDKDHLWHDKTGKVVEPPDPQTYPLIPPGLAYEDQRKYEDYKRDHEKNSAQGERGFDFNLDNAAIRPHLKDKHFDEKDHLWHDAANKVVEPPDPQLYPLIPPGLAIEDQSNWENWKKKQEKT